MIIQLIRPVDNVLNMFIVVIDGVPMTLSCVGHPVDAIKKLLGVNNG